MPLDATDHSDALTREAERCRRLADALTDSRVVKTLKLMAEDYERRADDAKTGG